MIKLSATNNTAVLVSQILSTPGNFDNPLHLLRAGKLMEKFEVLIPKENIDEWANTKIDDVEISEKEKDILRIAVEKMISKIPASKTATTLLIELGFDE